jgi:hypothetical protein
MTSGVSGPVISVMLAVPDARAATDWCKRALGSRELFPHPFGHNWLVGDKSPLSRFPA